MRCTPWILVPLSVALVAGCGGDKRYNDTGTAGAGTETGTMRGGAVTSDTAVPSGDTSATTQGMSSDTTHADAGMHRTGAAAGTDSAKANQTKSGVTNTKTGKSTLGKGVTKTRPDQGQPVTSKGDTISAGPDSTGGNQ
jgi:hypothetical protein